MSIHKILKDLSIEDKVELISELQKEINVAKTPVKQPKRKRKRRRKTKVRTDTHSEQSSVLPQKNPNLIKQAPQQHADQIQTRTEPMDTSTQRPNLFLKMREFNEHKQDIKIDKQLATNRTPSPRDRGGSLIEAQCLVCKNWYNTSSHSVGRDTMSGEIRFMCNNCQTNRRS